MAEILDGLKVSKEIKAEIKVEVDKIVESKRRAPHLVAILVGNNGASKAYVNAKVKDCEEVGFQSSLIKFSSTVSESELLEKIDELNKSKYFDENLTTKDMIANFKFELRNWMLDQFNGSRKEAILHFQNLGDTITEKTLDNWKNRR